MKLAIYIRGRRFGTDTTSHKQPLGESEGSIVCIAGELARQGHDVTVYANYPEPAGCSGVSYVHHYNFVKDLHTFRFDAVISLRSLDPFLIGRVAPRMIYWTGDSHDQPAPKDFGHSTLQKNVDAIVCVSESQRKAFIETFQLPKNKVIATRNGVPADVLSEPSSRVWKRGVWRRISAEWNALLEQMPAHPLNDRWSGPISLLQKGHAYLEKGNSTAVARVLTELDKTPFLRSEVENLRGRLNTWM